MSDLKSWRDIDREYLHPGPAKVVVTRPLGIDIDADRAAVLRWRLAWLKTDVESADRGIATMRNHPGYSDSEGMWTAIELLDELRALLAPTAGEKT